MPAYVALFHFEPNGMAPACVVCACPSDVYCHNDEAYLCFACDHTVHSAHALARTHHRTPIGEAVPQTDSIDEHIAVPQDLMPLDKQVCYAS